MITAITMDNDIIDSSVWYAEDPFVLTLDVASGEVDDFQHVNNVVYVGWMARAAWAHSKALGFDFIRYQELDCGFVVKRHEIDYRQACPPDERVGVATWISKNDGRLNLRRRFQMYGIKTQKTLAIGMSDFVTMRITTGRACRMPVAFKEGYPARQGVESVFSATNR